MSELTEGGNVYKKYDLQDESRVELLIKEATCSEQLLP